MSDDGGGRRSYTLHYDVIGQLTSFTRSDGQSESYAYDAVGNMTAKTQNGVKTAMRYNAANQLVQSVKGGETTTYSYDANGNLVKSENAAGARSYAYNARNLLAKYTDSTGYSEAYTYNANRLLSSITNNTGTTSLTWDILYGDGVVIGAAQNGENTRFVYGLERISAISGSSRTEYVYDGRGSVAAELIYNGKELAEVASKTYSPFGEQIGEESSGFGYNGEYYNAATGMVYLRARFYAPELNRFSQKDLLRGSIFDGGSLNRYLYCQNDPVDFADYNGRQMCAANAFGSGNGGGKSKISMTVPQLNTTANSNGEAIVVSGYEHKVDRFKYNFIESGIKGIKNYQAEGLTDITWIVFTENYSTNELRNFEATADSLAVKFIRVNNNQEFINYLNTGDPNTATGSRDNDNKITNITIYGHGYPGALELNGEEINKKDLGKLNPEVFDSTKTVLYTCRGANEKEQDDGTILPAIAQTFSDKTGGETAAVYGRVEYSYIAYTKEQIEERKNLKALGILYVLQSSSMQDTRPSLDQIMLNNELADSAWDLIDSKLKDDEIETLRKEFGYMQDGARYDPIPGKLAQDTLPEEKRDPAYWVTFSPMN